jgi:hypothetical protein
MYRFELDAIWAEAQDSSLQGLTAKCHFVPRLVFRRC